MIERFQSKGGRQRLIEALRRQSLIHDDAAVAEHMADVCTVEAYPATSALILQNESDNDIFFIISGRVSIVVDGREVARRISGEHVGEMAVIDTREPRSASVIAIDDTIVAKVSEPAFCALANHTPRLWRLLALELADRLRRRSEIAPVRRGTPSLLIGASTEALPIAREIQSALGQDPISVQLWINGLFGASRFPLADLQAQLAKSDFAVLILSADDHVFSKSKESSASRDNVLFQLGLFMGALQDRRTLLVAPHGMDLEIPTDQLGLTRLEYREGKPKDLSTRLEPVCSAIRNIIRQHGPV